MAVLAEAGIADEAATWATKASIAFSVAGALRGEELGAVRLRGTRGLLLRRATMKPTGITPLRREVRSEK